MTDSKLTSYALTGILYLMQPEANAQKIADSTMVKINKERAFYETLGKVYPPDTSITIAESSIAGIKSYWFNQKMIEQKRIIIYLHGGVYALGSINSYKPMVSHLAGALKLPILFIEYSLAPEHPYPAAKNEVFKVYTELRKKYPSFNITIIGDSAGGGLSVTLVHDCIESNVPLPNTLALISPWIDLKTNNNSYVIKQSVDPILSKNMLHEHAELYASNDLKKADPSELKFKKFPPVFLLVGTDEVLNDDSKNFYKVIKPIQKTTKLKEYNGQKHVWLFSDIHSNESIAAINDIQQFLSAN
ncbi:alpha/beta hydrolase [Dyadobacter sp. CY261]|uniref:alpha/beta hydrolase fold domain-containing protein n=1 Tax=Dyadobacter sp. CY261 TaxID=2907203 RepID=UPI001F369F6D|nr:alpha/beta hydrolase fold domain-containing protein [Dyadobacter sp. CY261]MCF0075558.1 alpha/beta hydrolase [Dyadobacter sp. CY261]